MPINKYPVIRANKKNTQKKFTEVKNIEINKTS